MTLKTVNLARQADILEAEIADLKLELKVEQKKRSGIQDRQRSLQAELTSKEHTVERARSI